jgi:Gp157 protein
MATTERMVFSDTTVPKKTLGQLSEEWLDLLGQIADAEGEITPEAERSMTALTDLLGDKVDSIGHVLKSLELQAIAAKERANYHNAQAKARENARDRLKGYLATVLVKLGTKKLAGAEFTAYLRDTDSVYISDQNKLPEECWRIVREIDKKGIGAALKDGKEIPGAVLVSTRSAYVR